MDFAPHGCTRSASCNRLLLARRPCQLGRSKDVVVWQRSGLKSASGSTGVLALCCCFVTVRSNITSLGPNTLRTGPLHPSVARMRVVPMAGGQKHTCPVLSLACMLSLLHMHRVLFLVPSQPARATCITTAPHIHTMLYMQIADALRWSSPTVHQLLHTFRLNMHLLRGSTRQYYGTCHRHSRTWQQQPRHLTQRRLSNTLQVKKSA